MLFDVHLELGNDDEAHKYLSFIEQQKSFDYLIRASKWNDKKGDLNTAISLLEKALEIAESSKDKGLIIWSYTNLADFYGHNNEIKKSYNYYLKSLELDPSNSYSKKRIAWLAYSYDKNPDEALRIINSVQKDHFSPDYFLLKSEIAEYMNNENEKNSNRDLFLKSAQDSLYGEMYNQHIIKLYLSEQNTTEKLFEIIEKEINNRPTPESYALLAWANYQKKDFKKALNFIDNHVVGKSFEPESLYYVAEIYKANKLNLKALEIKKELLESEYELGPLMSLKIQNI